jgi:hypothetical protein
MRIPPALDRYGPKRISNLIYSKKKYFTLGGFDFLVVLDRSHSICFQPGMAQGGNVSQLQQRLTQRMPNQMGQAPQQQQQQQRPQMMNQVRLFFYINRIRVKKQNISLTL